MMSKYALSVENISKSFSLHSRKNDPKSLREVIMRFLKGGIASEPPFWALSGVSFSLEQGDVLGIIGPNGSGKSTLLKILSKITPPCKGRAYLRGRVGSLLEVGTGFHGDLSGRDNIFLNGAILGMSRRETERHFDSIVSFAEVEKFLDTAVKHYSSGMYVRLAFAVAAHLEPEILILDEVLAVGDARFQQRCLERMAKIASSGQTILFVSHNLSAVRNFCNKALFLQEGKIEAFGSVEEVVASYIKNNGKSCSEKRWQPNSRPGNEEVVINTIALSRSTVLLSEEMSVVIDYELLKDDVDYSLALTLCDEEGYSVFTTVNNGLEKRRGAYQSRCVIYPNLLNEQRYYVTISLYGSLRSTGVVLDKVLFFDALDDGAKSTTHALPLKGCVRPKLNWITDHYRATL